MRSMFPHKILVHLSYHAHTYERTHWHIQHTYTHSHAHKAPLTWMPNVTVERVLTYALIFPNPNSFILWFYDCKFEFHLFFVIKQPVNCFITRVFRMGLPDGWVIDSFSSANCWFKWWNIKIKTIVKLPSSTVGMIMLGSANRFMGRVLLHSKSHWERWANVLNKSKLNWKFQK